MSTKTMFALVLLAACGDSESGDDTSNVPDSCTRDNIDLPDGFCASVYADNVGHARHVTTTPAGDVFVALANSRDGLVKGQVLALRDADTNGVAEATARFGDAGGTGITWHAGYLYFGQDDRIVRWPLPDGALEPTGPVEIIVRDLPKSGDHAAKAIQIGADGGLLVSIGSETNSCQDPNRAPGTPGLDPCPELSTRAGMWRFDATRLDQTLADGVQIAQGVRNPTAFAVHPSTGDIYTVNNGRDQLHEHWPTLFTAEDDKRLPSEELSVLAPGTDRGWPYCYHDPRSNQMMLAPEYGGDGTTQGRCAAIAPPMLALPAHWAALSVSFYAGDKAAYLGGAFVAFHGSRFDPTADDDAIPGYSVGFVHFAGGIADRWEQFATGFAGSDRPLPEGADHRPVGVHALPDGGLLITDDHAGRIWKVMPTEPSMF
jgi:glucose/arabinose dehydrogenase